MPTGHFVRTAAHCRAIGRALKGLKRGPMSPEERLKRSLALRGRKFSPEHLAKLQAAKIGRKRNMTEAWREKLRETLRVKARPRVPKRTRAWSAKIAAAKRASGVVRGSNNPNWRGGITALQAKIRNSDRYKEWRKKVYKRDGHRCRRCRVKGNGKNLQAHHKIPVSVSIRANRIEEIFKVSNGSTLCIGCHKKTRTYGWKSWNLLKKLDNKT